MRAIDDCAFVPSLETRRPIDGLKSPCNRRIVDIDFHCAKRGNCKSRIFFLMRPGECDGGYIIRISYEFQRRLAFDGTRPNHFFGLWPLRGRNNRNTWFDNASFFSGDFGKCFAQPFFVIEVDWRDHRNI